MEKDFNSKLCTFNLHELLLSLKGEGAGGVVKKKSLCIAKAFPAALNNFNLLYQKFIFTPPITIIPRTG